MKFNLRNFVAAVLLCGAATFMTAVGAFAADAAAGASVYSAKCKACHGADGSGNPGMAKMLKVEFKPLASAGDDEIKKAVSAGVGKMKPVAGVSGADLDNLVAAIHAMKK